MKEIVHELRRISNAMECLAMLMAYNSGIRLNNKKIAPDKTVKEDNSAKKEAADRQPQNDKYMIDFTDEFMDIYLR